MNDILNQLLEQVGPQGLEAISAQIGATEEQTTSALGGMTPTLLGAMASNSKSKSGAKGLLVALDANHDGSILDDMIGFVENYDNGSGDARLKRVLSSQRPTVEQGPSSKTGLNRSQVSNLLKIAAPLVLGYLGKQKKQDSQGNFKIANMASLLGGKTQQADQSTGLDAGDILQVLGGLSENSGNKTSSAIGVGKLFKRQSQVHYVW